MKRLNKKNKLRKLAALTCSALIFQSVIFPIGGKYYVYAEDNKIRPFTVEDAKEINEGKIKMENGMADSLLVNRATPLDPEADDDGDGLKNNEELLIKEENGNKYLYYKSHPLLADTDGDGIKDKEDKDPLQWDISARDAILFQELVYRDNDYIKEVLDFDKPNLKLYKDRPEYALMRKELGPYWEWQESYNEKSGFDAVLFKFSNKTLPFLKDSSVHMLGIRGTSDSKDVGADSKIAIGQFPDQAKDAMRLATLYYRDQKKYNNVYVTGHSLGGYLGQVFFVDSVGKDYPRWFSDNKRTEYTIYNNPQIKKLYTFNAPKITSDAGGWFNPWGYDLSTAGDKITVDYKSEHYTTANDSVTALTGAMKGYINLPASDGGHSSRSFFEDRYINQPGFSVGDRRGLSGEGKIDENLKKIEFADPTTVRLKDIDSTEGDGIIFSNTSVEKTQDEVNNRYENILPVGYEFVNTNHKIVLGQENTIEVRKKRVNVQYNFKFDGDTVGTETVETKYKTDYSAPNLPTVDDDKYEYTVDGDSIPKVPVNELTEDKTIDVNLKRVHKKLVTKIKFMDNGVQVGETKKIETLATDESEIKYKDLIPEGYELKDSSVNFEKGKENTVEIQKKEYEVKFNFITSDGVNVGSYTEKIKYGEAASLPDIPDGYILDDSEKQELPSNIKENIKVTIKVKEKEPEKYQIKVKFMHNGSLVGEINEVLEKGNSYNINLPETLKNKKYFILDGQELNINNIESDKTVEINVKKRIEPSIINTESVIYNVTINYMYGDTVIKTEKQKVKSGQKPEITGEKLSDSDGREYKIVNKEVPVIDSKDKVNIRIGLEPKEYILEVLYREGSNIIKTERYSIEPGHDFVVPDNIEINGKTYIVKNPFSADKINGDLTVPVNVEEKKEEPPKPQEPETKHITIKYVLGDKTLKEEKADYKVGDRINLNIDSVNSENENPEGVYVVGEDFVNPVVEDNSSEFTVPLVLQKNIYPVKVVYKYNGKNVLENTESITSGEKPIVEYSITIDDIKYYTDKENLNLSTITSKNKDKEVIVTLAKITTIKFVNENNEVVGTVQEIKSKNDEEIKYKIPDGYKLKSDNAEIKPGEENVLTVVPENPVEKLEEKATVTIVYKDGEAEVYRRTEEVKLGEKPSYKLDVEKAEEKAVLDNYTIADGTDLPAVTEENKSQEFVVSVNKKPENPVEKPEEKATVTIVYKDGEEEVYRRTEEVKLGEKPSYKLDAEKAEEKAVLDNYTIADGTDLPAVTEENKSQEFVVSVSKKPENPEEKATVTIVYKDGKIEVYRRTEEVKLGEKPSYKLDAENAAEKAVLDNYTIADGTDLPAVTEENKSQEFVVSVNKKPENPVEKPEKKPAKRKHKRNKEKSVIENIKEETTKIIEKVNARKAYIFGYDDGTFRPENKITRAEMAVIVSRIENLNVRNLNSSEAWYQPAIDAVLKAGFMRGYSNDEFEPDKYITRAELVKTLMNIKGISGGVNIFNDVENHWAKDAIVGAYNDGIVNGYSDGSFKPDNYITRAEAVKMINRFKNISVNDTIINNLELNNDLPSYKDVSKNYWAYKDIIIATVNE